MVEGKGKKGKERTLVERKRKKSKENLSPSILFGLQKERKENYHALVTFLSII